MSTSASIPRSLSFDQLDISHHTRHKEEIPKTTVFTYGMDVGTLKERLSQDKSLKAAPAELLNYELAFNVVNQEGAGEIGVAPSMNESVFGEVQQIDSRCIKTLDRFKGPAYQRTRAFVYLPNEHQVVSAHVYFPKGEYTLNQDDGAPCNLEPSLWYRHQIQFYLEKFPSSATSETIRLASRRCQKLSNGLKDDATEGRLSHQQLEKLEAIRKLWIKQENSRKQGKEQQEAFVLKSTILESSV